MLPPPPLRVVASTSGVLFVDKPAGLGFHTEGESLGVLPLLRDMLERGELPGRHEGRLYAVHRLDRVTSGVPRREPTGQGATARVGGTIVARSDSVQLANRRVYFPVEHCVRRHFQRSAKRWR